MTSDVFSVSATSLSPPFINIYALSSLYVAAYIRQIRTGNYPRNFRELLEGFIFPPLDSRREPSSVANALYIISAGNKAGVGKGRGRTALPASFYALLGVPDKGVNVMPPHVYIPSDLNLERVRIHLSA